MDYMVLYLVTRNCHNIRKRSTMLVQRSTTYLLGQLTTHVYTGTRFVVYDTLSKNLSCLNIRCLCNHLMMKRPRIEIPWNKIKTNLTWDENLFFSSFATPVLVVVFLISIYYFFY